MSNVKFINPALMGWKTSTYSPRTKNGEEATVIFNTNVTTAEDRDGKTKNIGIFSTEQPFDILDSSSIFEVLEAIGASNIAFNKCNKLSEKFKVITTIFNGVAENSSDYVILAVPFNGVITEADFKTASADATINVINATFTKAEPFTINNNSKVRYTKIAYFIIETTEKESITFSFGTQSVLKNKTDDGHNAIERKLAMEFKVDNMFEVVPELLSTNKIDAPEDGVIPVIKFSELFAFPVDVTVKERTNNKRNNDNRTFKNTNFKKYKGNPADRKPSNTSFILDDFFKSDENRGHEKPERANRKLEEAKKRYQDED